MLALTITSSACKVGSTSNLASDTSADRCATQRKTVADLERELASATGGGTTQTGTTEEQKCKAAGAEMNGELCACKDGTVIDVAKEVCVEGTRMESWLATSRNGDKALCDAAGGTFAFAEGSCVCPGSPKKHFGSFNIRTFCGKDGTTPASEAGASTGDYMGQCTAAGLGWADGPRDEGCRCPGGEKSVPWPYADNKSVCQQTLPAATDTQLCSPEHPGWNQDTFDCAETAFALSGDAGIPVGEPGFGLADAGRDRATIERELGAAKSALQRCIETTASGNASCAVVEKATGTVQATCFATKPESQCRSEFQTMYEGVSPGKYELKVYPGVDCDEARRLAASGGGTTSSTASAARVQAFETACRNQASSFYTDSNAAGGYKCICPSNGTMQSISGFRDGATTVFADCPRPDYINPTAAQLTEFRTQCAATGGTVTDVGGYNCKCGGSGSSNSLRGWMTGGGMGDPDYLKNWCPTGGSTGGTTGGSTTAATDREAQFRTACTAGNARIIPNSNPTLCECIGGDRSTTAISVWEGEGKVSNYYVRRCGARPTTSGTSSATTSSAATTASTPARTFVGDFCTYRVNQAVCGVLNCNGAWTTCRYTRWMNASHFNNNCETYCKSYYPTMRRYEQ